MKKILKSKIAILIVLVTIIIIEIIAFGLSRANLIEKIDITIIDQEGLLANEEGFLNAIDSENSGYYIILPYISGDKWITKYVVEDSQDPNNHIEVLAGSNLYLTSDELTNKSMTLYAIYDTKVMEDEELLYYKTVKEEVDEKTVSVKGYMPVDTEIALGEVDFNETESLLLEKEIDLSYVSLSQIYDISLISDENEYDCTKYEQDLIISISGLEYGKIYTLLSIKTEVDELTEEETSIVEIIEPDSISSSEMNFTVTELSTYAILESEFMGIMSLMSFGDIDLFGVTVSQVTPWDGTRGNSFAFGDGTQGSPYLISDGAELAYLADQVNAGNMYEGKYFQLTHSIDLGGRNWTPIGTFTNSFRGIFDGAGHTISNGTIPITALPAASTIVPYGLFGSIGGDANYLSEIRNLQLDNVNVYITATGTLNNSACGYSIGNVTGIMYIRSKVSNVIVKNSTISNNGTIAKNGATSMIYVGGIAGSALNTSGTIDAGAAISTANKYVIENCYVQEDINLTVTYNNAIANINLYNIGGIIGHIRRHQVWPTNCLYQGEVTAANAMVGPIFGAERYGTTGTTIANSNTIWGGDTTTLTANNLYHNNYIVNGGSAFTSSQTAGGPPVANVSHRKLAANSGPGYVQGVNKGSHEPTISSRLTMFQTYATNNNMNVNWGYDSVSGKFYLQERHSAVMIDNSSTIDVSVVDPYIAAITYNWYINYTLNNGLTGTTSYPVTSPNYTNKLVQVVTFDGAYYSIAQAFLGREELVSSDIEVIPWNGTDVSTGYIQGNGDLNDPYLITSGADLKYLSNQVIGGNNYATRHFQVTADIDLGGNAWIPIGTQTNSFRGTFNGAGHTISNAIINTQNANTGSVASYGLFGSIADGAEIKNVELNGFTIALGTAAVSFNANGGYHAGFIVGTMYNNAKVVNCIVKNSSMGTPNGTLTMVANAQLFLGGIAGSVGTPSTAVPTAGQEYSIKNCYVYANIATTIAGTGQVGYNFSSGGIVGRIHNQPAWPGNCLYEGTINTHGTDTNGGYIGPIFGSLVSTSNPSVIVSTANLTAADTIFSGTANVGGVATNLTMTSYYRSYTAKITTFNTTASSWTTGATPLDTKYRISSGTTQYGMARYQGVNKGIYNADKMDMFVRLDGFATNNNYVSWEYNNGNYTFVHRHHVQAAKAYTQINTAISDDYHCPSYVYRWYADRALQLGATGANFAFPAVRMQDQNFTIITFDGSYYGSTTFLLEKTKIDIKFIREGDTLTAKLVTEAALLSDPNFTHQWYRTPRAGGPEEIMVGATTNVLNNLTDEYTYRLVLGNTMHPLISLSRIYNPVLINDYEADWNYYTGLNYVQSDAGTLPTGINQNLYNETNLVRTMVSYSGSQEFGEDLFRGTVSLTETESEYVYYKYYPVVNGKVRIELIDNPFINRPTGKGFNNWVPNNNVGTISFDSVLYKRYIEVPVTYTSGVPNDIVVSLSASWVEASAMAKDGANTWVSVFAGLKTKGMSTFLKPVQYEGQSMAGYYVGVTLSAGTSLTGYYNATGQALSGNAVAGTTYYRLIQNYDVDKLYNGSNTYYYMATRDTNIVYLTANLTTSVWAATENKPFTFTGLYGGIDYSTSYTWNVASSYVTIYNDTTIEHLTIASTQATTVTTTTSNGYPSVSNTPSTSATTTRYIYGNFNNLKVGRGIKSPTNTCAFTGIVAGIPGGSTTSSATNPYRYHTMVESGTYLMIMLTTTTGSNNVYVDMYATYGCDYDRVKASNSNLDVRFVASRLMGRKPSYYKCYSPRYKIDSKKWVFWNC